ncbi:MAG: GNAT family N-acetyltransferase [Rikenellaceae bacterium]|nr:GNAT family N-acetyltransferase [Rikenellaceae bacterium]
MQQAVNDRFAPISEATSGDYDDIMAVWEASVRATHGYLAAEDIDYYRICGREALPQIEVLRVYRTAAAVAGFYGVNGRHLELLFVSPACIGSGIGSALFDHAVTYCGIDSLEVNEQNPRARMFYERKGFRFSSRSETDPYGKPYPILTLVK